MTSILNGLNKQGIILRNSVFVAILELIGLYIFTAIPQINIYGYAITLFLTSLVSYIINIHEIKKHIQLDISKTNTLIYLLLSLFVIIILNIFIKHILFPLNTIKNLLVIAIVLILYLYFGTLGSKE